MSSPSLRAYDRAARTAAGTVIAGYSTSFGLACRLLGPRVREHVRSIYALVRVADEIVDGAAAGAGLSPAAQREVLDAFEEETLAAVGRGFSADLIVHAFAGTVRSCGIDPRHIRSFFASMRTDLDRSVHDARSHEAYVYGSAEVIGLMCLQVFVAAGATVPVSPAPALSEGARRLGAAFQDINFLRDREDDGSRLGRDYLGAADPTSRAGLLARIDADLAAADAVIDDLPADCRRAVRIAHDLFAALARRLRIPGPGRARVPDTVKVAIAVRAVSGVRPRRSAA